MVSSSVGLSSGLDYSSILAQLRAVNQQPITILQRKGVTIQNQQGILAGVKSLLDGFKSSLSTISKAENFAVKGAASSDTAILVAASDATASLGNFSVEVKQLAKSNRVASQGYKTVESSVASGAGSFKFKIGDGTEHSVTVGAGTSLAKLRDDINNLKAGVRASIVNDGSPTNPYRLVLTADATGAKNAINITQDDTNLYAQTVEASYATTGNAFNGTATTSGTYTGTTDKNFVVKIKDAGAIGAATFTVSTDGGLTFGSTVFTTSGSAQDISGGEGVNFAFTPDSAPVNFAAGDSFSFNAFNFQLQKAQDAIIKVDGVQISRDTNVFQNAVDGVTLTAKKESTDAVNVAVTANTGNVISLATDLVAKYNALIAEVNKQTAYDSENKKAAALFGDTGLAQLRQSLTSTLNATVAGLSGSVTSLRDVGIKQGGDNTLTLDAAAFSAALKKDPAAVQALFTESGRSTNSQIQFQAAGSNNLIGNYAVNITQAAERASVAGSLALAGGLAASERLIVTLNDKSLSITLDAGLTIDQVVTSLNDRFADEEFGVQATNDNGTLRLTSAAYGLGEKVSVFSNRAASAAGQLGIGISAIEDTGLDVAGTIGGFLGKGDGQNLRVDGGALDGLRVLVTATAATSSTLTISQGAASTLLRSVNTFADPTNGLFAARDKSYTSRITDITDQIDKLNARIDTEEATMKKRFVALEQQLSSTRSQGDYLLKALTASLNG